MAMFGGAPTVGAGAIAAVDNYIEKMLNSEAIQGMKALLLDEETKGIVALARTQSEILAQQVFLVETIRATHERMMHLKAVVFVRPTRENVQVLARELADPKYGEYHIFFSNIVPQDLLQTLAEADSHEVVKQVHEYYADFYPVGGAIYTLNVSGSLCLSVPRARWTRGEERMFDRAVQGLLAALLAFKKRPVVRFQRHSELAGNFAREVAHRMKREQALFDFRHGPPPVLLVLDRRDDPVTPLLTQWTYQAMVHELLGMHNNRVDMSKTPNVKKDFEEIVLSETDPFFKKNVLANFGDLGMSIKELLDGYQKKLNVNRNIQSIDDMQRFVASYPEFRKHATNVTKHVSLMSELARLVDVHALMDMSQLEQEIACVDDHAAQLAELTAKVQEPGTSKVDAVRLVILYALRYETYSGNRIAQLKGVLQEKGVPRSDLGLVDGMLEYAGNAKRAGDLFQNKTFMSKLGKTIRRQVKGCSNVYTQHSPLLASTLEQLLGGRLKESAYPCATGVAHFNAKEKPREVFVFMLGGVTFEEHATVLAANAQDGGARVMLGGTFIHNSQSFLKELGRIGPRHTVSAAAPGRGHW